MLKLKTYSSGEIVERPWGSYEVVAIGETASGEGYCEKRITVLPKCILSLQSHNHRRETWKVLEGTLDVILSGQLHQLNKDQHIDIPLEAAHCMANLGDKACVVQELQLGVCSEEDIVRYLDAYGRGTFDQLPKHIIESGRLYSDLLEKIS